MLVGKKRTVIQKERDIALQKIKDLSRCYMKEIIAVNLLIKAFDASMRANITNRINDLDKRLSIVEMRIPKKKAKKKAVQQ